MRKVTKAHFVENELHYVLNSNELYYCNKHLGQKETSDVASTEEQLQWVLPHVNAVTEKLIWRHESCSNYTC